MSKDDMVELIVMLTFIAAIAAIVITTVCVLAS